ncbi:hypothetical protein GCM10010145_12560 [Streptomyces ruber]|uniref:Uncharacterized protein n=2 Tax=Streptomyces TaxID=1883 RepID=A0A918B8U5_9ACTN|nr:hypothetical protein [Streptomyces ruber]GGQ45364.1 hypothetical protein GCM10010145_12560 [Streptomyces ruber]
MRRQVRNAGSESEYGAGHEHRPRSRPGPAGGAVARSAGRPMTANAVRTLQLTAGNAAAVAAVGRAVPVQRAPAPPRSDDEMSVDETPVDEKPMDAESRLRRAHQRAKDRLGEGEAPLAPGEYQTPFGPYTVTQGRGGVPWIRSNARQHPGSETIGEKYEQVVPQLDADQFGILTNALRSGEVSSENLDRLDATQRRAAAMLYAIAASEENRFPGAGKALRSALDRQSDPYHEAPEFLEDFPMGKASKAGGGARYYQDVLSGKKQLTAEARATLEAMSSSSDENASSSSDSEEETAGKRPGPA